MLILKKKPKPVTAQKWSRWQNLIDKDVKMAIINILHVLRQKKAQTCKKKGKYLKRQIELLETKK